MLHGFLWPIIIAILVLGIAYVLFYMLPAVHDDGNSFLWIIAGFVLVYILAATYLGFRLPSPLAHAGTRTTQDALAETTVSDVTVTPDRLTK